MDLCSVQPGEFLLDPVDLFDGNIGECAGSTFVRAFVWEKCFDTATLVLGYPLLNGFVADISQRTVGIA